MNELNSVKYRRLPHNVLPNRLTSTVGGVDYYLTEVRNIVRTPQDVATLWGCAPDEIKILGIDLGQACVVGASALLPEPLPSNKTPKRTRVIFQNLAIKQKAVYQPGLKHRRWMQEQKAKDLGAGVGSISDIETALPPRRGENACFTDHIGRREQAKGHLDTFYNGNNRFKKHKWEARRAKEEEYRVITDRLLKLVGGSIGAQRDEANKVIIGIGLGKLSSNTKLTSLHESFQSYFVQKARSLGYIVVGVNEYYTSKKCPKCEEFVGQVEIRRLFCSKCKSFMHRDIMAGHNICNAIRGHLREQQRPEYLQPVDKDGRLPWMNWITTERSKRLVGIGAAKGKAAKTKQGSSAAQKRAATDQDSDRPPKRLAKGKGKAVESEQGSPSGQK
ncbi:hypothetical protein KVV02_002319 [Mortierella alpina]|uniref:Cas12f1-like TNB domain-containing protein n=1 Tax=Mortierella alpina TaxID=64518 RepID=A0A9P8A548_MORAP|nr:hypothetical protein KVV02_002319 [Mortierella alpina]